MPDEPLTLAALGLLWRLLERDTPNFTLAEVRALELGSLSKDRASRLINELRLAGYVRRTRGGFAMDGLAAEQWETDTTPTPAPALAAASYTAARCA